MTAMHTVLPYLTCGHDLSRVEVVLFSEVAYALSHRGTIDIVLFSEVAYALSHRGTIEIVLFSEVAFTEGVLFSEVVSLHNYVHSDQVHFTECTLYHTGFPPPQSQSHGKIVRRLSKKLKVASRTRMHPHSADHAGFVPVRSSSPVLMSSNPVPLHMQSLLEDDRESVSTASSGEGGRGGREGGREGGKGGIRVYINTMTNTPCFSL